MSADFWPYLSGRKGVLVTQDPVNVVFYGNGGFANVSAILQRRVRYRYLWSFTRRAAPLYARIDNGPHGGHVNWKGADVNLRLGPFPRVSFHIRVYESPMVDSHGQYGTWSLASVHTEILTLGHTILSWTEGRDLLRDLLTGQAFVSGVTSLNIRNDGIWQGRLHDGQALLLS